MFLKGYLMCQNCCFTELVLGFGCYFFGFLFFGCFECAGNVDNFFRSCCCGELSEAKFWLLMVSMA